MSILLWFIILCVSLYANYCEYVLKSLQQDLGRANDRITRHRHMIDYHVEAHCKTIDQSATYLAHLKMAMWNLRQSHEKLNTTRNMLTLIGHDNFPEDKSRAALKEHWKVNQKNALRIGSTI